MLPVAFKEFGVIYVLLLFSFHYHCDLVKDQVWQKSWGGATAPHPPVFTGLMSLVNAEEHRFKVLWTREQGKEKSVIDDVMPNTKYLNSIKEIILMKLKNIPPTDWSNRIRTPRRNVIWVFFFFRTSKIRIRIRIRTSRRITIWSEYFFFFNWDSPHAL